MSTPKSIAGKEMQKLVKFAKALDRMNKEWFQKLADQVVVEAQNLAPVGSGHLKASHKNKIIKKNNTTEHN